MKTQNNLLLSQAVVSTSTDEGRKASSNNVNRSESLLFPTTDTDLVFIARQIYLNCDTYSMSVMEINTAVALFATGATFSLIHSALIHQGLGNVMKRETLPRLLMVAKLPFQIESLDVDLTLIVMNLGLGDLYTRVFFGIASKLAVNMQLATLFMDRFLCRKFPSE